MDKCPPGPAPPVRYEGLLATEGRPDPEPPLPPAAGPLVAIAVGKTKEGESLPAKPARYWLAWLCRNDRRGPTKFRETGTAVENLLACSVTLELSNSPSWQAEVLGRVEHTCP